MLRYCESMTVLIELVVVLVCWLVEGIIEVYLRLQIVDPRLASYGVENPLYAVIQLAQTTMRSELGKITLDKTFEERDTLNEKIVVSSLNLLCNFCC